MWLMMLSFASPTSRTFFLPFLPRFCIRLDCQLLAPAADAIESLAPFQCRVDAHHVV